MRPHIHKRHNWQRQKRQQQQQLRGVHRQQQQQQPPQQTGKFVPRYQQQHIIASQPCRLAMQADRPVDQPLNGFRKRRSDKIPCWLALRLAACWYQYGLRVA